MGDATHQKELKGLKYIHETKKKSRADQQIQRRVVAPTAWPTATATAGARTRVHGLFILVFRGRERRGFNVMYRLRALFGGERRRSCPGQYILGILNGMEWKGNGTKRMT